MTKAYTINFGPNDEGKKLHEDLEKVQKELQKRTHMKVSKTNALRVLIKHWEKTHGEYHGI